MLTGVLRAALVVLIACDAGVHEDVVTLVTEPSIPKPAAPAPTTKPPNPVTTALSASAITVLTGCWRHDASETWTFRHEGSAGLVVVRELRDTTYAGRARIPQPVTYDPTSKTFGFGAAGRIHGLMMLFQIDHSMLKTWVTRAIRAARTPGPATRGP